MNEPGLDPLGDQRRARQRARSLVIALALVAFAILMFAITIVRIGTKS